MFIPLRVKVFGISLFLLPIILAAQDPIFYFHKLTTADNLTSQTYNLYIYQDSRKFVWISSINGLNRFDGKTVKQYVHSSKDTTSLLDNNVHSQFFEDKKNDLWFSTNSGIHRYDRKQDCFQRYLLPENPNINQNECQLLFLDSAEQKIWIKNKDNLYSCPISEPSKATFVGRFGQQLKTQILKNISGETCLLLPESSGLGMFVFENGSFHLQHRFVPPNRSGPLMATSYLMEDEKRMWLGTKNGLFAFNIKSGAQKRFRKYKNIEIENISDILKWSERELLVSTYEKGIFVFHLDSMKFTSRIFSDERDRIAPFSYSIERMYLTPDGTLWIYSPGNGIFFTQPEKRKFNVFVPRPGNKTDKGNFVRSMVEDENGNIICLSRRGLVKFREKNNGSPGDSSVFLGGSSISKSQPYQLLLDRESNLWVCSEGRLYVSELNRNPFKVVNICDSTGYADFVFVHQLKNGRLIGSAKGLYEIKQNNGRWETCLMSEISNSSVRYSAIYEDQEGHVFVSKFGSQILIFKPHPQTQNLTHLDSVDFGHMVTGMLPLENKNGMWVASDGGLFKLKKEKNRFVVSPEKNCPFSTLNGLLKDKQGRLWMSTNKGLGYYNPDSQESELFDLADGLQGLEFNFWSYLKTKDGAFAFGGVNGVNWFYPENIAPIKTLAMPTITDIQVNNLPLPVSRSCIKTAAKNVNEIQHLDLRYNENTISFHFSALDYSEPNQTQIRYKLSHFGKGVIDEGFRDQITYPNVEPGDYLLALFAANSDGVWTKKAHTLRFTIHPHWSATLWFRSLICLALLAIIIAIYRNRLKLLRHQKEIAESNQFVAEARQREAEANQQKAEIESAIHRIQMNPHFIFNSLNSIRNYIQEKDIDTADGFLMSFAKLMRKILEMAERPVVELADEIELLDNYMEIEALRFEDAFTYEFDVPKELDLDDVVIPTMILQPFVENSIIHGFRDMGKPGHIIVKFRVMDDVLHCSVRDNGVGRGQATSIPKTHTSKALEITQKRLKLIEEKTGKPTRFEIVDHKDPSGTEVILEIPMD